MEIKARLNTARRNSQTAALICDVVTASEPIFQNLEASPDLQEPHVQAALCDLKVFVENELDGLTRELAEQWELTRLVYTTGNEERMKQALEHFKTYQSCLELAVNEAFQKAAGASRTSLCRFCLTFLMVQAGRERDETIMKQNRDLQVP